MDLEIVQITATQVVFDLIQLYGVEAFEINQEDSVLDAEQINESLADDSTNEDAMPSGNIGDGKTTGLSVILNGFLKLLDDEVRDALSSVKPTSSSSSPSSSSSSSSSSLCSVHSSLVGGHRSDT